MPRTYILRHRKERLSKCSLRGLETHPDLSFYSYPEELEQLAQNLLSTSMAVCLTPQAPPLRVGDLDSPLLLLDATWRLSERLFTALSHRLKGRWRPRSLPSSLLTAYPRRQSDCPLPGRGLASVEALAAIRQMAKGDGRQLLTGYRWREEFLMRNEIFFKNAGAFLHASNPIGN